MYPVDLDLKKNFVDFIFILKGRKTYATKFIEYDLPAGSAANEIFNQVNISLDRLA